MSQKIQAFDLKAWGRARKSLFLPHPRYRLPSVQEHSFWYLVYLKAYSGSRGMYSHIMRICRPAGVPPKPAAPPLPRGVTPRPGCTADPGRRTWSSLPGRPVHGGVPGPLGTLRPPGVWYIACHKRMRTLFRGAAAGADGRGRGRGDGRPPHRNLAGRQPSHYIRGGADTMRGGAYSIAGRRGNGAGRRTHYGTGRCRAES